MKQTKTDVSKLIVLKLSTKQKLDKLKLVGEETYNSVVERLIKGK